MDRIGEQIRSKWISIAIGAGTLVLALIAFSGICWGTLVAWSGLAGFGFWEFFGLAIVVAAVVLMIRPIGRRFQAFWAGAVHIGHDDSPTVEVSNAPASAAPAGIPATSTPAAETDGVDCSDKESWRALYDQLSEEERREFKALMAKYCGCSAPEAAGDSVSGENPASGAVGT